MADDKTDFDGRMAKPHAEDELYKPDYCYICLLLVASPRIAAIRRLDLSTLREDMGIIYPFLGDFLLQLLPETDPR